jgi:RNA polymerase sigma-70 factor (ECF subfamily)
MTAVLRLKLPAKAESLPASPEVADSFRCAYAEHFQLVWRGLRRLGVPESLVDDAVQDVFLVVHRRWADFEGRSQLRTWIYGIAARVAKDYRRAEARRNKRVQRLTELCEAEPRVALPSDEAERRDAHRVLHGALAKLSDEERAVFVLAELEELGLREVCVALGLQPRTCQRRLRKARRIFEQAVVDSTVAAPELNHD